MNISVSAFTQLTTAEQMFALTDLERVARNLPPVDAMTTQLDNVAAGGANNLGDPSLSGWQLTGGKGAIAWDSNWAGGLSTAGADYFWLYSDGEGLQHRLHADGSEWMLAAPRQHLGADHEQLRNSESAAAVRNGRRDYADLAVRVVGRRDHRAGVRWSPHRHGLHLEDSATPARHLHLNHRSVNHECPLRAAITDLAPTLSFN